jgi:hypothetical protein
MKESPRLTEFSEETPCYKRNKLNYTSFNPYKLYKIWEITKNKERVIISMSKYQNLRKDQKLLIPNN